MTWLCDEAVAATDFSAVTVAGIASATRVLRTCGIAVLRDYDIQKLPQCGISVSQPWGYSIVAVLEYIARIGYAGVDCGIGILCFTLYALLCVVVTINIIIYCRAMRQYVTISQVYCGTCRHVGVHCDVLLLIATGSSVYCRISQRRHLAARCSTLWCC